MEIAPRRLLVSVCLCVLVLAVPVSAEEPAGPGVYVVRLEDRPVAGYRGGVPSFAATRPEAGPRARGRRDRLDAGSAASRSYAGYLRQRQDETLVRIAKVLGRQAEPLARYAVATHGFALELSPGEAKRIARVPGVAQVERSREMVPQSDAGPAWIGADTIWDGSGTGGLPGTRGEGMVVGVIDTGLNAGHPSFADVGGDGYDHTNPRGAGQYVGRCDPADPAYDPAIPCNDKLIGLWAYGVGSAPAPDETGHGTHVAAIAVGNHLSATVSGPGIDLVRDVSGVAPHANLIAYDACPTSHSCSSYLFLEAVDQAVADGVDVVALGFGAYLTSDPWEDALAAALLNAREAGVFVAVPAGNDGFTTYLSSVAELPWVMALTATTHHRRLVASLKTMSGGDSPPPADIQGWGLSGPYGPAPIVPAWDYGDGECTVPFPAGTWSGEIVVCAYYPWNGAAQVSANVLAGGAGGVLLADYYSFFEDYPPPIEGPDLPWIYIRDNIVYALDEWLGSGAGHTAVLSGTLVETHPSLGDIFYAGSSRGPSLTVPGVVKPDLAAPGVDILAADHDSQGFVFQTGTSMGPWSGRTGRPPRRWRSEPGGSTPAPPPVPACSSTSPAPSSPRPTPRWAGIRRP
ncbi:MAG TPA: S8 family serine peptidase [Thermoanaerobaculia bacterium]|nr:S8 family serine peptidase [Thermoanaerobaculia bacterium]